MILHGVDEQSAKLTFIPGIGPKWLRKLMNDGIKSLPDLAAKSPTQLQQLRGLSQNRAENWINAAHDLLDSDFQPDNLPSAPFFRAKPQGPDLKFDPYPPSTSFGTVCREAKTQFLDCHRRTGATHRFLRSGKHHFSLRLPRSRARANLQTHSRDRLIPPESGNLLCG